MGLACSLSTSRPSFPTKACPLAAPAGHGDLTLFFLWVCLCMHACVVRIYVSAAPQWKAKAELPGFRQWVVCSSRRLTPVGWRPAQDFSALSNTHTALALLGWRTRGEGQIGMETWWMTGKCIEAAALTAQWEEYIDWTEQFVLADVIS